MSNADLVAGWYQAVQFRAPPPDERAQYVNELDNAVPAVTVQNEILKLSYTVDIVDPVIREYQAAFDRVPDQSGETVWVNAFGAAHVSLNDISFNFANSPEFQRLYQANAFTLANQTLVDAFYHNVLQRAPDPAGETFWINSGLDAAQLLQYFAQSPEMMTKATPYITSYQFGEMAGSPQISGSLIPASFYVPAKWTGVANNDGVNGGNYPPDNATAVGTQFIVTAENSAVMWSDLFGGIRVEKSFVNFFSSIETSSFIFDPRAVYDPAANRFVVIADQGASPSNSAILIAVSRDANPNDGWFFQSVPTNYVIAGHQTWADYPMLAIDQSYIYLSTNQYLQVGAPGSNANFASELTVLNKSGVYSGGQSTIFGPAQQQQLNSNNIVADPLGGAFLVNYSGDQLNVVHVNGTVMTPVGAVRLGDIDLGATVGASQPNTSVMLDPGDKRVLSLAVNNNQLYAIFEIQPTSGSSTAAVHWVDMDVTDPLNPKFIQQGSIFGATLSPNATTFNGSVGVDKAGDVIINFNASGPSLAPNDYFIVHRAIDPAGVFSAPVLYMASSSSYTQIDPQSGVARWGDYSSALPDPSNASGFWISSEFATSATTWSTSIAHILGMGFVA